ncbi:uncharacterized protein LOC126814700 isoform X2 [Patella vulgata]|uniref:uncharacterized protein LOC126814700 isoform X2 n=1 Tax=Patella vulgata TaxID=6465 RepID=UPI0024A9DDE7|nr:uncharacterized protein LOC126814700 isoform X2 [Patella vulgata]
MHYTIHVPMVKCLFCLKYWISETHLFPVKITRSMLIEIDKYFVFSMSQILDDIDYFKFNYLPNLIPLHFIFSFYDDIQYLENFRMSKCTFEYLCRILRPFLEKQVTSMREPISVERQIKQTEQVGSGKTITMPRRKRCKWIKNLQQHWCKWRDSIANEPLPDSTNEPLPDSTNEPLPGSQDQPGSRVEPLPGSIDEPFPGSRDEPLPGSPDQPRPASRDQLETNNVKTFHHCVFCDEIFKEYSDLDLHYELHVNKKIHVEGEKIDSIVKHCKRHVKTGQIANVVKHRKRHVKKGQIANVVKHRKRHVKTGQIANVVKHRKRHVKTGQIANVVKLRKRHVKKDDIDNAVKLCKRHVQEEKIDVEKLHKKHVKGKKN